MSEPPLLPPRKKDWTKGIPQVGAFLRTADGDTIQMVNDKATDDEKYLILAFIHGIHTMPKEAIASIRKYIDGRVAEKK